MAAYSFDDQNIKWHKLGELKHLVYSILNIDEDDKIIDVLFKFAANQQIVLHRHMVHNNTFVVQGEHRLYEPDGKIKEIRGVGSYTSSPPGDAHREGGGHDQDVGVFFNIRANGGVLYELLDDNLNVIDTLSTQDFIDLFKAQQDIQKNSRQLDEYRAELRAGRLSMPTHATPETKLIFGSAVPRGARMFAAVLGLLLATATGAAAGEGGDAQAGGAFTCDFGLSSDPSLLPPDQIAPSIERDRMYMAARPGLLHKHIPISFDPNKNVFSGGRYLFDTAEHAREYRDWVFNTYVLDGVHFLKRPYFLSPDCHAWTVIGAHDFEDIHSSQIVLRTERWSLRNARQPVWTLRQRFDAILASAQARGLTSVWLLYDQEEGLASLVYFGGRVGPSDPGAPDMASLDALAAAPPLRRDIRRPGLDADLRPYPMGADHLVPVRSGRSRRARLVAEHAAILLALPGRRCLRGEPRGKFGQQP